MTTVQRFTFGTAGHIDHGKSALVKALTGRDPDARPEEKQRGMTMDLGFCFMELGREEVAIIDVPGHEDFLRTTIAGVSGIDFLLLIVDLSEGIMPQTREHLEVALAMGIDRGIVVLTKADLVDEEMAILVADDVSDLLRGTPLEDAEMVVTSVETGQGLDELRERMIALTASGTNVVRDEEAVFRTPIDRVFTLPGFGTIVAGTVACGRYRLGEELLLLPRGRKVRVRSLQVHGTKVEEVFPGQRAAFNLAGMEVESVERGDTLTVPDFLRPTSRLDLWLEVSKSATKPLRHHQRVRFLIGTSLSFGRVSLLDADEIPPGRGGFAQITLEKPVVVVRNEPFVICNFSTLRVIGRGWVVFPYALRHRRYKEHVLERMSALRGAELGKFLELVLSDAYEEGGVRSLTRLARLVQEREEKVREALEVLVEGGNVVVCGEDKYISRDNLEVLKGEIEGQIKEYLAKDSLSSGVSLGTLRQRLGVDKDAGEMLFSMLESEGRIVVSAGKAKIKGEGPAWTAAQRRVRQFLAKSFAEVEEGAGVGILSKSEIEETVPEKDLSLTEEMVDYLCRVGELIPLFGNLYISAKSLAGVKEKLTAYLKEHGSIRAADFKDFLSISRRQATSILDYFSDTGVTRREKGTHFPPS